jgi:hypothetical protein
VLEWRGPAMPCGGGSLSPHAPGPTYDASTAPHHHPIHQVWPLILSGHDLIGIAATGSGKTLGFGLPMLAHITAQRDARVVPAGKGPYALVMAPTRELACQIAAVIEDAGSKCGITSVCVYGGVPKGPQVRLGVCWVCWVCWVALCCPSRLLLAAFGDSFTQHRRDTKLTYTTRVCWLVSHVQVGALRRGVDVVVGTPGRLEDLMQDGACKLQVGLCAGWGCVCRGRVCRDGSLIVHILHAPTPLRAQRAHLHIGLTGMCAGCARHWGHAWCSVPRSASNPHTTFTDAPPPPLTHPTQNVTYLVLDEADRMLDLGFEPHIRAISSQVRARSGAVDACWSGSGAVEGPGQSGHTPLANQATHPSFRVAWR